MPSNKRQPGKPFEGIPRYTVPGYRLFDGFGTLALNGVELSVYLYYCGLTNRQDTNGRFTHDIEEVINSTGYEKTQVWRAMRSLQDDKFIVKIESEEKIPTFKPGKGSSPSTYAITSPYGGSIDAHRFDKPLSLRGLLFENKIGYYDIPKHIFENLKALKGETLQIVVTGVKQAIDEQNTKFTAVVKNWKQQAGVTKDKVVSDAWDKPVVKTLMRVSHLPKARTADVEFYDPEKGTTLAYTKFEAVERAKNRDAESAYEAEHSREYNQQELQDWFCYEFPEAEKRSDGEIYIMCPVCKGTRLGHNAPYPTLHANFSKCPVGVIACNAYLGQKDDNDGDARCTLDTKHKVPYHFVAMKLGISPNQAKERMRDYILCHREGTAFDSEVAVEATNDNI